MLICQSKLETTSIVRQFGLIQWGFVTTEQFFKDLDQRIFILDQPVFKGSAFGIQIYLLNRTIDWEMYSMSLEWLLWAFVNLGSWSIVCLFVLDSSFCVFCFEMILFIVVNTIKEQILDLRLLSIVEGLICSHSLVVLLLLFKPFLKHKNIEVPGCIIRVEKAHYLLWNLLFRKVLIFKHILNIVFDLIIGTIYA